MNNLILYICSSVIFSDLKKKEKNTKDLLLGLVGYMTEGLKEEAGSSDFVVVKSLYFVKLESLPWAGSA